jgi:sugar phosphate isomerase/epimerase
MRRALRVMLVAACLVLLVAGQSLAADAPGKKITFTKYPNFKLGFLSASFGPAGIGPSLENAKMLIDFGKEQGFAWMELRDASAELSADDIKAISKYAESKKIEIVYASNRGPLDGDYWQVLGNSWRNALLFKKGTQTVRMADSGDEFGKNPQKKAWTEDEFKKAVDTTNKAAKGIKGVKLNLVVEHANLPILGPYGFEAFVDATDKKVVGLQLDTGNMFCVSRGPADAVEVERMIRKVAPRLYYTHLKASVKGVCQTVLTDSELDFGVIFEILAKNKKNYIGIELVGAKTVEETRANFVKSLEYLKDKGFITIK